MAEGEVNITQFDDAGTLSGTEKIYLVRGTTDYNTTPDAIKTRVKGDIVNDLTTGGATKFASADTVKSLNTTDVSNYAKAVEMIAHNATAPTPIIPIGTTKTYKFSTGGAVSWLSNQVVEVGDEAVITRTGESAYTRTFRNVLSRKVDDTQIYNGLDKTEAGFALDARQGKAIYDSYLESLPDVGIAVQQSGDGSSSTTMSVYTLIATTATITGGTFSGGLTTLTIPARTNTNVIFSLSLSKGLIQIKGLSKINSVTTPTNAPILAREAAWVLPSVMTYFSCEGSNTLSGVLSLPPVMTYFVCFGSNTLTGVLSLPSVMTYFRCSGSNTLSGVLSLPSVMTYFVCFGSNTLTYPSAGVNVFSTTFRQFFIRPQSTWTSAMTDAVLIDAAATITTASNEKTFDIRGNAGARTSASDSAKAYLESIGFTILTN